MEEAYSNRKPYLFHDDLKEMSAIMPDSDKVIACWSQDRADKFEQEELQDALADFYILARADGEDNLSRRDYVGFIQRIALALFSKIDFAIAERMARLDWNYDNSPGDALGRQHALINDIALERFSVSLFEIAELILPAQSTVSAFLSFFLELKKSISVPGNNILRPLQQVERICEAFVQDTTAIHDNVRSIRGLPEPNTSNMSLKQCLISRNPQRLQLSNTNKQFIAHDHNKSGYAKSKNRLRQVSDEIGVNEKAESNVIALTRGANLDKRENQIDKMNLVTADRPLVICVIGPTFSGKSRLAQALAEKFGFICYSVLTTTTMENIGDGDSMNKMKEMLLEGGAISRDHLLATMMPSLQSALQEHDGIILDDIYPHELCNSIHCDLVISLQAELNDLCERIVHTKVHDTTYRYYSDREFHISRASLNPTHISTILNAKGYSSDHGKNASKTTDDLEENKKNWLANSSNLSENILKQEGMPIPITSSLFYTSMSACQSFLLKTTANRSNVIGRKNSDGCKKKSKTVLVLATQPIHAILKQCLYYIHGNVHGISRFLLPRHATHVQLPDDLLMAERLDQIKWILQSNMIEPAVETASPDTNRALHQLTMLSDQFAQFCPVAFDQSDARELILGDPKHAAYFRGYIYLLASNEALCAFCTRPFQYLKRNPSSEMKDTVGMRIVVFENNHEELRKRIAQNPYSANVLDAFDLLQSDTLVEQFNKTLASGESIKTEEVLRAVSFQLIGKRSWILLGLPCTVDSIEFLRDSKLDMSTIFTISRSSTDSLTDRVSYNSIQMDQVKATLSSFELPVINLSLEYNTLDEIVERIQSAANPSASKPDDEQDGLYDANSRAAYLSNLILSYGRACATDLRQDQPIPKVLESASLHENLIIWQCNANKILASMGEIGLYCPVTWMNKRELVYGKAEYASTACGQHYLLAGSTELVQFRSNPMKYISHSTDCKDTLTFIPWVLLLSHSHFCNEKYLIKLCKSHTIGKIHSERVDNRYQMKKSIHSLNPSAAPFDSIQTYINALQEEINDVKRKLAACKSPMLALVMDALGKGVLPLSMDLMHALLQSQLTPSLVIVLDYEESDYVAHRVEQKQNAQSSSAETLNPHNLTADRMNDVGPEDTQSLIEEYKDTSALLHNALECYKNRGIPTVFANATGSSMRQSIRLTVAHFQAMEIMEARRLTRCELLSQSEMMEALSCGRCTIGKYDTNCPITGQRICADLADEAFFCVKYLNRLYFPKGSSAFVQFASDPDTFSQVQDKNDAVSEYATVQCGVVGPPNSGKTRLARAIATHFNLVYVSPASAAEWVLQFLGDTELRQSLLKKVQPFDPALVHRLLKTRLLASDCECQGWVLDGFYLLEQEYDFILSHARRNAGVSIIPSLLFQTSDNSLDSNSQFFLRLMRGYSQSFGMFHYQQLQSWISGRASFWKVFEIVRHKLQKHFDLQSRYLAQSEIADSCVNIYGILISADTIKRNLNHKIGFLCPVELSQRRLCHGLLSQRRCVVRYKSAYYFCFDMENMRKFMDDPNNYLQLIESDSKVTELLDSLPLDASLLSLVSDPEYRHPELRGYCPVTWTRQLQRTDDPSRETCTFQKKGFVFFRASFRGKSYYFSSEIEKQEFLHDPLSFSRVKQPLSYPPKVVRIDDCIRKCSGYYEQLLSPILNKALLVIGRERLKFPRVNMEATACYWLGLFLKSENLRNDTDVRANYKRLAEDFRSDCALAKMMRVWMAKAYSGDRFRMSEISCKNQEKREDVGMQSPSFSMDSDVLCRFDQLAFVESKPFTFLRYALIQRG